MKKFLLTLIAMVTVATSAFAGDKDKRIAIGAGVLYENGLEATVSFERENAYHNAWEFFATGYTKWAECKTCGHICTDSFWKDYRTWDVGVAYKPNVWRGKNHYGNARIGGSLGSDTDELIGIVHIGYEHNYRLKKGWQLYWQAKTEIVINGKDLFRTGVAVGLKIPTN